MSQKTTTTTINLTFEEREYLRAKARDNQSTLASELLDAYAEKYEDFPRNSRQRGGQPGNKNSKKKV